MSYRLTWCIPHAELDAAQSLLAEIAPWGWEEITEIEQNRVHVHVQEKAQLRDIKKRIARAWPQAQLSWTHEQDEDWQTAWQFFFQPIEVASTFRVLPPWKREEVPAEEGLTQLIVHPKMAFGTGHHPSTRLCLQAMVMLQDTGLWPQGEQVLDVGTGSDILAVAAALLGSSCLALDIDPVTMDNAKENAQANGVLEKIGLFCGDIRALRQGTTFPLVVANILAGPLIRMAPELSACCAPAGTLLLSGVLQSQVESVAQAYALQGLGKPQVMPFEEWAALVWTREAEGRRV